MSDVHSLDIYHWLSDIVPPLDSSLDSLTSTTVTHPPLDIPHKRKRSVDSVESHASKNPRLELGVVNQDLQADLQMSNIESPRAGRGKAKAFVTPATSHQSRPSSRATQETISQNSEHNSEERIQKVAANIPNIREALANNGMHFRNDAAFEHEIALKELLDAITSKERNSAVKPESLQKIRGFRDRNNTANERTYFGGLLGKVIKEERMVDTRKRDAEGEVIHVAREFSADGLKHDEDVLFLKGCLPGIDVDENKALGLTTPKPDRVYGLQAARHPTTNLRLSAEVQSLIGYAGEAKHPFFVIEGKSCRASIEVAEVQAIRTGAALVNTRRRLNYLAKKASGNSELESRTSTPEESFAFSCTWTPKIAELWVHWHQRLDDGTDLFHMNSLQLYVMSRDAEVIQFRRDVHNILDWGVSLQRKKNIEDLLKQVTIKHDKQ